MADTQISVFISDHPTERRLNHRARSDDDPHIWRWAGGCAWRCSRRPASAARRPTRLSTPTPPSRKSTVRCRPGSPEAAPADGIPADGIAAEVLAPDAPARDTVAPPVDSAPDVPGPPSLVFESIAGTKAYGGDGGFGTKKSSSGACGPDQVLIGFVGRGLQPGSGGLSLRPAEHRHGPAGHPGPRPDRPLPPRSVADHQLHEAAPHTLSDRDLVPWREVEANLQYARPVKLRRCADEHRP